VVGSTYSNIQGGSGNTIQSDYSSILGGGGNLIDINSDYSAIINGFNNAIDESTYSILLGGEDNGIGINTTAPGIEYGTVVGGKGNIITYLSDYSALMGGSGNTINIQANFSSIIGGSDNSLKLYSNFSSIIGGENNLLENSSERSNILGGLDNTIQWSSNSSIVGGINNIITGETWPTPVVMGSGIFAGKNNTINGHDYSVIIGGTGNTIDFDLEDYLTDENQTEGIFVSEDCRIKGSSKSSILNSSISTISGSSWGVINNSIDTNLFGVYYPGGGGGEYNNQNTIEGSYLSEIISYSGSSLGIANSMISNSSQSKIYSYSGSTNRMDMITILGSAIVNISNIDYLNREVRKVGVYNSEEVTMYGEVSYTSCIASYRDIWVERSVNSMIGACYNEVQISGANTSSIFAASFSSIKDVTDNPSNFSTNSFIAGSVSSHINSSNRSAIIGGQTLIINTGVTNSLILGGEDNSISNDITGSVVIGGNNIVAVSADTVYVPNLNIGSVPVGSPTYNLGLDTDGNVVTGNTAQSFTGGTVTGDTIYTGGLSACTSGITTNDIYTCNSGVTIHSNLTFIGQANNPLYHNGSGSSFTIDWNESNIQTITLTANTTINNPVNVKEGASYSLIIKQAPSGPYTINSWGSNFKFEGGTFPALSTGTTNSDIITFITDDGGNLYGIGAYDFF
jgi:hypothetical protein